MKFKNFFDFEDIWEIADNVIRNKWNIKESLIIPNYNKKILKKLESYNTFFIFLCIYIAFSPISISAIFVEKLSFYEKIKLLKYPIIIWWISWQIIWIFWLIEAWIMQIKINKAIKIIK